MKKFLSLSILALILTSCGITINNSGDPSRPVFPSISEPSVEIPVSDPYTETTREMFYANYTSALSYEEAQFRTSHGFMSGDITFQQEIPADNVNLPKDGSGKYYRVTDANYTYDNSGNYLSYTTNRLDGRRGTKIFYGGAYTSLEEVAAYLLAFGELPPNSDYYADETYSTINTWGEYGRVNKADFTNDTTKYKYEPSLAEVDTKNYVETDFGTIGFKCGEGYPVAPYNDGYNITRGAARLCFTTTYKLGRDKITEIAERHVFYTYNHYNDFQEYLNYEGGWGEMFGFMTAGNDYCSGRNEYSEWEEQGKLITPPTQYVETTSTSLVNIIR